MSTVSARVLKDELSTYLQRSESGEEIVVLHDSRPVAALVPLSQLQGGTEQQRLAELGSRGLMVLPRRTDRAAFQGPVFPNRGKLASEMIIEDDARQADASCARPEPWRSPRRANAKRPGSPFSLSSTNPPSTLGRPRPSRDGLQER